MMGLMVLAIGISACHHDNEQEEQSYKTLIGTWGVDKLEYWLCNVDYAGQPIAASFVLDTSYDYDVNDPGYGIQLVYNSDKTGEYRDFAIDSMWFKWNETNGRYDVYLAPPKDGFDSVIYCPDTTLVYSFRYLYDAENRDLIMKMSNQHTLMMTLVELTENSIVSENPFDYDETTYTEKIEKFYLKRVGDAPKHSAKAPQRHHPVSRLTQELFHQEH